MGILNIRPVESGGSKVLIALCGVSGSGKTYTALEIAMGMVDDPKEIGFLDTENKRGSLYANILGKPFNIGDLYAPFSPKRYAEAIKEFQDFGVKVLVIDSGSHEWEGEGGCEDIANSLKVDGTERKIADWKKGKSEHKKFMNALLHCNMHVIVCLRAREKTDFKDPNKPVSLGVQPICEKNFMFEMTASLMMSDEGKRQHFTKVPSFLKEAFGNGSGYLGRQTGKKILEWINHGEKDSPDLTRFKSEMLMACELGLEHLKKIWADEIKKLSQSDKEKALKDADVYKNSALAYDEARKMEESQESFGESRPISEQQKKTISEYSDKFGMRAEKEYNDIMSTIDVMTYEQAITAISYLSKLK